MNNILLVDHMREVLGASFALYMKTHAFHWNVEGINFPQLHALFSDQYIEIWNSLDVTAEHIRALDAYAPISSERLMDLSPIKAAEPAPLSSQAMLIELLDNHEVMIAVLKQALEAAKAADEEAVVNYLGGRLEAHAKHRWMLRVTAKPSTDTV